MAPVVEARGLNHWTTREVPGFMLLFIQEKPSFILGLGESVLRRNYRSEVLRGMWLRVCLSANVLAQIRDPTFKLAGKPCTAWPG